MELDSGGSGARAEGNAAACDEGVFGRAAGAGEPSSAQTALNGGMASPAAAVSVIESNGAAVRLAPGIESGFDVA